MKKIKLIVIAFCFLLLFVGSTSAIEKTDATNGYFEGLIVLKGWILDSEINGDNITAHAIFLSFVMINKSTNDWEMGSLFYPTVVKFEKSSFLGHFLGRGRIQHVKTLYHGALEINY